MISWSFAPDSIISEFAARSGPTKANSNGSRGKP